MDVRCARCSTEYEFDDALVSERGTTVKCTNCGHQFKVFPGGGGGHGPERWIVRKASGRELVYTSLKDLQRAISQRQVGPTDMLSRGGGQPLRSLGDIAELEPFFQTQSKTPAPVQRTLLGLSPKSAPKNDDDTVRDAGPVISQGPSSPHGNKHVPSAPVHAATSRYEEHFEPKTVPRNATPQPMPAEFGATLPAGEVHPAVAALDEREPPTHQIPRPANRQVDIRDVKPAPLPPQTTPTPSAVNDAYRSYEDRPSDSRLMGAEAPRPSKMRWVVGVVLLAALAFVAATFGRKYLATVVPEKAAQPPPKAAPDERVTKMLEEARQRFYDGDLEEAKERLDKASVLAEKNPKIHAALARLEAARADVFWLAIRLASADEERVAQEKRLEARMKKVDQAVQLAVNTDASDPDVVRARIDQLRLSGAVEDARKLVRGIETSASDPETGYVLAALDLSEQAPAWPSVIDRFRTAAGVEGDLGRARAALVYALAKSGAGADAARELEKLATREEKHPLYDALKAFVDTVAPAPTDIGALPEEPPQPEVKAVGAEGAKGAAAGSAKGGPQDFRTLLTDASQAKSSGDLIKARTLYSQALEKAPGNVEAMAGLADVARAQGDTTVAARYYDEVLAQNPNYLPALSARADMKWAAGDRAGAVTMYKRILQQAGAGSSYAQRAQQRIAEHEGQAAAQPSESIPSAPESPPAQEAPPPSPPPPSDKPHIDTSDLPGFGQ